MKCLEGDFVFVIFFFLFIERIARGIKISASFLSARLIKKCPRTVTGRPTTKQNNPE